MKTLVLEQKDVDTASELLRAGEVVCFPTETVYGAGAICTSKAAFDKLVAVKRRPADKPFTLMDWLADSPCLAAMLSLNFSFVFVRLFRITVSSPSMVNILRV